MMKIKTILLAFCVLAGTFLCACGKSDSSTEQSSENSSISEELLGTCTIGYGYWNEALG